MKDSTCLRTITVRRTSLVRAITGFRRSARLAVIATFAGLLSAASPALATHDNFAVLAGSAVTCTDSTVVGDVGVDGVAFTPTSCTVSGTVHVGDVVAAQAYNDFLAAYTALATAPACTSTNVPPDNTSATLAPGVYCFDAAVTQTGTTWTLNGSATDTWIFRIGTLGTGALTGTNFTVVNPGDATCDNNVFWWTAQAATLTDSVFIGSILAGADITTTRSSLAGQVLAGGTGTTIIPTGAVTLTDSSSVCGPAPSNPIPFVGTLKTTGGGQIPVPLPTSTGRASFGFNAKGYADGTASGQFTYVNLVTGLKVSGPVTTVEVSVTNPDGSPNTVRFFGTCSKLPACSFIVTVQDNGEPGTSDQFGITVTGGRTEVRSQRVISRGNIQFHIK